MENKEYTYKAFISYRHLEPDKTIAKKLQNMLERYMAPKEFRMNKKWRVFRDETELPTSSDLSNDIKTALGNSEFLIVVCSTETSKSRWCREEISYFKSLHSQTNKNIITLLTDGEPKEAFPPELCTTVIEAIDDNGYVRKEEILTEPLAANIAAGSRRQSLKKLKSEFLRLVAPLLGCGYDDLYNRERRRRIRTAAAGIAAAFIGMAAFGTYNSVMLMKLNNANSELLAANEELKLKTEELDTSNAELTQANNDLDNSNAKLTQTNAELDSTNAELDSTNTELEQKNSAIDQANKTLNETNKNLDKANSDLNATNKDLDKANADLQKSNADLDTANSDLQESNKSLEEKTAEAEENLEEANKQRDMAEQNLAYANEQKTVAEENLAYAEEQKKAAEENLAYAEEQKKAAEENLAYAEEQKKAAEENLALVNQKNSELRISTAKMAAKNAETYIADNDRESAIKTILDNRPYEDNPNTLLPSGMNILSQAVYAYQSTSAPQIDRYLKANADIKKCEYSPDRTKLFAYDEADFLYVWNVDGGEMIFEKQLSDMEVASFISDSEICVADSNGVFAFDIFSGNDVWRKSNEEMFGSKHLTTKTKISDSKSTLMLFDTYYNKVIFLNTETGDVIYADTFDTKTDEDLFVTYGVSAFYSDDSKLIMSYCTHPNNDYSLYETKFIQFNIAEKTYEILSYKTDMEIYGLTYCASNAFSFEGHKKSDSGYEYRVDTIRLNGTEIYSTQISDFSQWFEDIIFRTVVYDDLKLLALTNKKDLIFFDVKTGEIYDRTTFDSEIMNVYTTTTAGILRVLCRDGVYTLNLNEKTYRSYLYFDDEKSQPTEYFLWGDRDHYAVVGKEKNVVVLYKNQVDDNCTEVQLPDYYGIKIGKGGYFMTRDMENLYIYRISDKQLTATIPYSYYYYFSGEYLMTQEENTFTWYDMSNGSLVNSMTSEKNIWVLQQQPLNESCLVSIADNSVFKITDDIRKIYSIDREEGWINDNYYVNCDGSQMIISMNNYVKKTYELRLIDLSDGNSKVLYNSEDDMFKTGVVGTFGKDKLAVYSSGKIIVLNTVTSEIETEINMGNLIPSNLLFTADESQIIVYGSNNIIYKYNVSDGEQTASLSLPLEDENDSAEKINMSINDKQNHLILQRGYGGKAWFIDLDSFEIAVKFDNSYVGMIESTQEVVTLDGNTARFYPYHTSEMLIQMAEEII